MHHWAHPGRYLSCGNASSCGSQPWGPTALHTLYQMVLEPRGSMFPTRSRYRQPVELEVRCWGDQTSKQARCLETYPTTMMTNWKAKHGQSEWWKKANSEEVKMHKPSHTKWRDWGIDRLKRSAGARMKMAVKKESFSCVVLCVGSLGYVGAICRQARENRRLRFVQSGVLCCEFCQPECNEELRHYVAVQCNLIVLSTSSRCLWRGEENKNENEFNCWRTTHSIHEESVASGWIAPKWC